MKILIVEDTEVHAKLIKIILKKIKNVELISAQNAFEAYAILKVVPEIELLILDNEMPYVKGVTFHDFLRESQGFKDIPIIFSAADVIETEKMKNSFFIKKPYIANDLLELIITATKY